MSMSHAVFSRGHSNNIFAVIRKRNLHIALSILRRKSKNFTIFTDKSLKECDILKQTTLAELFVTCNTTSIELNTLISFLIKNTDVKVLKSKKQHLLKLNEATELFTIWETLNSTFDINHLGKKVFSCNFNDSFETFCNALSKQKELVLLKPIMQGG